MNGHTPNGVQHPSPWLVEDAHAHASEGSQVSKRNKCSSPLATGTSWERGASEAERHKQRRGLSPLQLSPNALIGPQRSS